MHVEMSLLAASLALVEGHCALLYDRRGGIGVGGGAKSYDSEKTLSLQIIQYSLFLGTPCCAHVPCDFMELSLSFCEAGGESGVKKIVVVSVTIF
jgi:hypothetical protein